MKNSSKEKIMEEFDRECPVDRAIIKHVGQLYGVNIVTEEMKQVDGVEREKARKFLSEALDRTREDAVRETIEIMKGFYVDRNSNGWNEQLDTMIKKLKEINEKQ